MDALAAHHGLDSPPVGDAHFAVDILDDCVVVRLEITALDTMLAVHASLDEVR